MRHFYALVRATIHPLSTLMILQACMVPIRPRLQPKRQSRRSLAATGVTEQVPRKKLCAIHYLGLFINRV